VSVDDVRFADQRHDPDGQGGCIDRWNHAGQDDGEFVAAKTGERVGCPDGAAQSPGDLLQQFIPDGMSHRVVHVLEVVDAEIEHGNA